MTGANRLGSLHRVADNARAIPPDPFTPAELHEAIIAPPAIGETLNEVIAEASWPADRPVRVPDVGRRP
jgi:hypothetical protein